MRISKIFLIIFIVFFVNGIVFAQVQTTEDIINHDQQRPPAFQDHGGVTPWFWIGIQTVFGGGYNFETTAGGFRNYGGDDHTYISFNLAFVDSHYQTPKFYEVPQDLSADTWSAHFYMLNFTSRLNSWEGGNTVVMENNAPAWLAEITGMGARIGFFTQAANLVGGINDPDRDSATSVKPIRKITGGNKVLNLQKDELGKIYYEKANTSPVATKYGIESETEGGIWYVGYEKKELFDIYLTMLSQGDVNSDVGKDKDEKKGFAGVFDFSVSPFGKITDEQNSFTFIGTGNLITGFNWKDTSSAGKTKENIGFGLSAESGVYLGRDNLVLSPVVAFDGRLDSDQEFFYRFGGGLTLQFSGMRWTSDDWGDLYNAGRYTGRNAPSTMNNFADLRYENNQVLKYAYAQVYAASDPDMSKDGKDDMNMVFRLEEPDGNLGFHDKLGFLAELRLYNLAGQKEDMTWEAQGRVSWDLNIKSYLFTPYVRAYINHELVTKLRMGAQANVIPYTGFELAYTTANLNPDADTTVKPMGHYDGIFDAGRIEFLVILKSDDRRPNVPKRMSDWNYPSAIQKY
jgi:hypothetical protein